jgi:hypothetical protein
MYLEPSQYNMNIPLTLIILFRFVLREMNAQVQSRDLPANPLTGDETVEEVFFVTRNQIFNRSVLTRI